MRQKALPVFALVALIALSGCRAQEGAAAAALTPSATPPRAITDIALVETNSQNNAIAPLLNDVDESGTGLTITAVQVYQTVPAASGSVVSTNGSAVTFTPPPNYIGVVTLAYGIRDGTGATSSALIAVSVLPVALMPIALPDSATVLPDAAATDIDVLANDVDFAGGGLTLTGFTVTASVPAATHTVAISGNQLRFTPAAGFVGAVVVTYTLTDINGATADGVLTIVVSPVALPAGPVPVPDAATVAQNAGPTLVDVLANDIDTAGGGLTVSNVVVTASVPAAAHAVAISGNQVQFTPAAAFVGAVVVTYTATDADGNSADGVLTVVVAPTVPVPGPVPLPDAAIVAQDSGATLIDVLANDIDPAAGGLTLSNVVVTATVPAGAHTVGVSANRVQFTPAAGFAGAVVVTYTATDVAGNSADGALNVVVTPLALPVGLVAIPDAAVVAQDSANNDIDVLANDVDFAGGGLTLAGVSVFSSLPAAVHAVSVSGNQVRFTPAAGFAGVVVVSYTATDVNGVSSNGLLNVTVTPAALALGPVAVPDVQVASSSGGAVSFDVLANDIDPAGGGLTLTAASIDVAVPAGAGAVAIVGNQVQYTPTPLYVGAVLVRYTATDSNGNTTDGELSLTVTP